jgi:uncharacterized RDD family membrane protein YckC
MVDRRFGGFWRRLLAFCIDKVILYFVILILCLLGLTALASAGVSLGRIAMSGDFPHGMSLLLAIYFAASTVAGMTYFTWFHGTLGQTPGKMALGLRVIQTSGEEMNLGVAFLRWAGSLVSTLVFCLGYAWIAFDGRKQGWHDKIAATLVIRSGSESAPETIAPGPSEGTAPATAPAGPVKDMAPVAAPIALTADAEPTDAFSVEHKMPNDGSTDHNIL